MKKVWRVFVSSTFEDFRLERAVLQKFIFPEIKKEANEKEISFLPIDLRWGVPGEAQIDQRTMDICLGEVERATTEPHPDFLILSGDKYGWVPIPRVIEKEEFEDIINKLKELKKETNLLETWYELDENQIPYSYILKPRDEITDKDYKEWENWEEVENKLRELLQTAVNELNFDKEKKEKYFISATHEELKTFLKHKRTDKNLKNHMFSFIRRFNDLDKINKDIRKKLSDEQTKNIENFRKEIKTNILKENLKESDSSAKYYERKFLKQKDNESYFIESVFENINSLEEIKEKLEDKEFAKYLVDFGNFIKEKLLDSLKEIKIKELTEKDYQKDYKEYLLNRPFVGREKEIEEILKAVEENSKVLIYGESGIGKSAIMARVINELEKNNKLVYRFCGVTQTSSNLINMLDSVLVEMGIISNENKDNELKIESTNEQNLIQKKLQEIGYKFNQIVQEVIIVIDAIDQLGSSAIDELEWLPNNEKVKIIITALKDESYKKDTQYYNKLKNIIHSQIKIERINNPKLILKELLRIENRSLTDKQYEYINKKKDSNKPLFLSIAKEEVKYWRSSDKLTDKKNNESKTTKYLSDTQKEIIEEFIQNLYEIHHNSKELVEKVFGYISASQEHLSEELLLEVLSNDKELMHKIENKYHKNLTNELPPAVWSRLRWMIKDYIKEDENGYIKFFHREFGNLKRFDSKNYIKDLLKILEKDLNEKNIVPHIFTLANYRNKSILKLYDKKFLYSLKDKKYYFKNLFDIIESIFYGLNFNKTENLLLLEKELLEYLKKDVNENLNLQLIQVKIYIKLGELYFIIDEIKSVNYYLKANKLLELIYKKHYNDYNVIMLYAEILYYIAKRQKDLYLNKKLILLYKLALKLYKKDSANFKTFYLKVLDLFILSDKLPIDKFKLIKKEFYLTKNKKEDYEKKYINYLIKLINFCFNQKKIDDEAAYELLYWTSLYVKQKFTENNKKYIKEYIQTLEINFFEFYINDKDEDSIKLRKELILALLKYKDICKNTNYLEYIEAIKKLIILVYLYPKYRLKSVKEHINEIKNSDIFDEDPDPLTKELLNEFYVEILKKNKNMLNKINTYTFTISGFMNLSNMWYKFDLFGELSLKKIYFEKNSSINLIKFFAFSKKFIHNYTFNSIKEFFNDRLNLQYIINLLYFSVFIYLLYIIIRGEVF